MPLCDTVGLCTTLLGIIDLDNDFNDSVVRGDHWSMIQNYYPTHRVYSVSFYYICEIRVSIISRLKDKNSHLYMARHAFLMSLFETITWNSLTYRRQFLYLIPTHYPSLHRALDIVKDMARYNGIPLIRPRPWVRKECIGKSGQVNNVFTLNKKFYNHAELRYSAADPN